MTNRARWIGSLAMVSLAFSCVWLSGCSSSGTFDGRTYTGAGYQFRVPALDGSWERLEHSDAALAYRNEAAGASILLNGRCDIDGEDVPLAALMAHLFIQFTERDIRSDETVPLDSREALHRDVVAKLDGVPYRFDAWVLKKDRCVFDLLYFAEEERFATGLDDFRAIVAGFRASRQPQR